MRHSIYLGLMVTLLAPTAFGQMFRSDDPVWVDNDTAIAVKSMAKHKLNDQYDFLIHTFGKPGDRRLRRAMNVNTLGEVPDSSWYQNRHGRTRMTVEELVRGPNTGNGPATDKPWMVIAAKTEGITPGFRIRDSRGHVYFVKFDPPQNPEMATAAEVISTKFFYALGYNVPENYLAFFTRQQLQADAKATITDAEGRERRLTESDLDAILKRVHQATDGTYRAIASKQIQGSPLGPFQYFGTRPDDPNDIFPHEHRRELRGMRVFAAWLNHDDSRAINSLDVLAGESGHKAVRHYLIDFGSTLGSGSVAAQKPRAGWEYMWEPETAIKRIVTLGLWDKKWIRVPYNDNPAVGRFESEFFEPQNWKPEYPNPAFLNATDDDTYWAAKIVMTFSDDEIRAIVKTGQFSDPRAEQHIADTLIARRDKVGRYWLTRKSSFDNFTFSDGELRFDHLASQYDFGKRPVFSAEWFVFDPATGKRWTHDEDDFGVPGTFSLAEIKSAEGTIRVYVRHSDNGSAIVGIER